MPNRRNEDRIQEKAAFYIKRSASMLGIDRELASRHLQVALDNIQAELDQEELRDLGIIPVQELQAILPVFQEALVKYLSEYVEWTVEQLIKQFQTIATKEIKRVSELVSMKYIKDNGVTEEQLQEIMSQSLFVGKKKAQTEIKE
jgi:hypothetical protein